MAKDNEMMNWLLIAGGAWLVYEFFLKPQMGQQQLALPPASNGNTPLTEAGGGSGPGSTNPASIGQGGMTIQQLEQKMRSAAQGDTNPFNVWRWSYYYAQVTGNPAPDVHLGFAFPGKQVADIEGEIMSFSQWLTLARQYAVNPESQTTGGWDPISQFGGGMGFIADTAKQGTGYSRAHGVAGMGRSSWGQRGSAQFSDWAGGTAGRYRSKGRSTPKINPRDRPAPGRPVLEMPSRG